MLDVVRAVLEAKDRIYQIARETPIDHSPYFSELGECDAYFKLENLQHTGAFKLRGASNKILSLTDDERDQGCVAASTGNHGMAVSFALGKLGSSGLIFVPETTEPTKVEAIRRLGGEVRFFGKDGGLAEIHARKYADEHGMVFVSPYNDPKIIGGQGTIGWELSRQLDKVDRIYVAVGAGGLISGIAGYLKSVIPDLEAIGCLPEASPVMLESIEAGHVVPWDPRPTLSDGTAGTMEADTITLDLCRELIDDWVVVSEEEIAAAMRSFIDTQHMLLEGSAGVAVGGFLKSRESCAGKTVAILICGGNFGCESLKSIL